MRVAFFGTPDVAVPCLDALLGSDHEVVVAVTQPDRPRGRSRTPSPPPVKQRALEAGLDVLQPQTPKDPSFAGELRSYSPDALAVVAYGHILPVAVLEVAPAINVHFSLLPRYRGAAPVQRALMDGARETGVSVFLLEPTVDTGPVLVRERIEIGDGETAGDLFARLVPIGARLLVDSLDMLASGSAHPIEQDDVDASAAPKIKPAEAVLDWSRPAIELERRVRGLSPRPGAYTMFRGRRLAILRARAVQDRLPEGVMVAAGDGILVGTGEGSLHLGEVQPEGKRAMTAAEFARGYRPLEGERVGDVLDEGGRG